MNREESVKEFSKLPTTDEEVKARFCTRQLGTTGLALFGLYEIRRKRDNMNVEEAYLSTCEHWVKIICESE